MWYLLLVFTIEIAGFDKSYLLKPKGGEGYETKAACLEVRAAVQQGMSEAYPGDGSYRLVCYNPEDKET
jgi:hypothetical protein